MRFRSLLLTAAIGLVAMPALADGDPAAGEKVFAKCKVCHTIDKGGKNLVGPNLYGVLGRKAGTLPGFAFSKGLTDMNFTWDEAKLAEYVADPKKFNPTTKMIFVGLKNQKEIDDVIAYIKAASAK